jgi:hypothetical protein
MNSNHLVIGYSCTLYCCMQVLMFLCTMLVYALLWCGNVRFGFLFALQGNDHFGLDMVHYLGYFNVMLCMCDDNNSCRCQHKNTQHKCKDNWLFWMKTHYGWLHNFVTIWLLAMEQKLNK